MHVFYVQGGGLGHMTRVDKLIRFLDLKPENIIIISPSIFAHHFKAYTFKTISWNASVEDWTASISKVLLEYPVTSFYIDAFPMGLKGELIPIYKEFKELEYVYISRILKWDIYLMNMPIAYRPFFNKTLALERVYTDHYQWISQRSKVLINIDLTDVYKIEKSVQLTAEPYILIVHSGGIKEVLALCEIAERDIKTKKHKIIVFTQVDLKLKTSRFHVKKSIFPVSQYFKYAEKIYTAAGFNSIHELHPYKSKHVSIAFNKLYDDQIFRKTVCN